MIKLPPLLLGATLLFWGWQTDMFGMGCAMAIVLEGARLIRFRWELTDEDFNRLWNLCTLIFIAASVYAFTANQGPAAITRLAEDPNLMTQRLVGETSQRTAASLIRWLPMVFFPFVAALVCSRRDRLKLPVFSLIARRHKRRRPPGPLAERDVNAVWVFFGICLISASITQNDTNTFFAGLAVLLLWALWTRRSRRFGLPVWVISGLFACGIGFLGQQQLSELRRFVENYAPQWPWRWSGRRTSPNETSTAIGQLGKIQSSGRIVIRLEPKDGTPPPGLLRTASYRIYRSPIWAAGNNRSDLGGMATLIPLFPEPKTANWMLRNAPALQKVNIATFLEDGVDLLPLPSGVTRLEELPVFAVKTNGLGMVMAEGPGVVLFDAAFGPIGTFDAPPTAEDGPDGVPDREAPALNQLITHLAFPEGASINQKLRTISAYFQDHYTYTTWLGSRSNSRESTNSTPLARFLLQTHRGHCEYFATATVLLLRQLGIPARYAVGWAVQEPAGTGYVVRERHAHAWCLAYYNNQWHDFDTTPASWVEEENRRASPLQFLSDGWNRLKFEFLKWRWGQSNLRDYIWWIVGPMLLFLLYRLLRHKPGQRAKKRQAAEAAATLRFGLDSEFYLVERRLADYGFIRPPGETLGQFLQRAVRDGHVNELQELLLALLALHYRLRFDPLGLTAEEREAMRLRVRETLQHLGNRPKRA